MVNSPGAVARSLHYWGSITCLLPVLVVTVTGTLLLLKKELEWVQPATVKSTPGTPTLSFNQILDVARGIDALSVTDWQQIDRLDVRPDKGVIKIRATNRWEAQINHTSGAVLKVAYRRSDLIESLHDGSFFHSRAKLGLFLPSAMVLLMLTLTGLYLFLQRFRFSHRQRRVKRHPATR